MTTIKARFDGSVFVPEEPLDLPVGYETEITVTPISDEEPKEKPTTFLADLAKELAEMPSDPDWPEDGAEQHDHYLYGTPKNP